MIDATRPRAGSREAKRLATRERLFTAAVAEFKRSGMADADVAAIVEAAGVAHGTFFFHFPTKEHVLAELGQREEVRMAAALPPLRYAAALPRSADLVVIGGGIVGAATAFFAARAGLSTVILEKRPALCTLTTPVSTGAFRLQFDNPEEIALVREGVENMRKLVYAFYHGEFRFRQLTDKYPDLVGDITDCLSGDVNKDFTRLFNAVAEFAPVPKPLPVGMPLVKSEPALQPV